MRNVIPDNWEQLVNSMPEMQRIYLIEFVQQSVFQEAEFSGIVILYRLFNFFLCIHYKGAIAYVGLIQRFTA